MYTKKEIREEIAKASTAAKAFETLLEGDCWPPENWDEQIARLPEEWREKAEEGLDTQITIEFGYGDGPIYVYGDWQNKAMAEADFQEVRDEILVKYSAQIYALPWVPDFLSVLKEYEEAQAEEVSVANVVDMVPEHYERLEPGLYPAFEHEGKCAKCGEESSAIGRNPYCLDENLCEKCYSPDAEYVQWAEWFTGLAEPRS